MIYLEAKSTNTVAQLYIIGKDRIDKYCGPTLYTFRDKYIDKFCGPFEDLIGLNSIDKFMFDEYHTIIGSVFIPDDV